MDYVHPLRPFTLLLQPILHHILYPEKETSDTMIQNGEQKEDITVTDPLGQPSNLLQLKINIFRLKDNITSYISET